MMESDGANPPGDDEELEVDGASPRPKKGLEYDDDDPNLALVFSKSVDGIATLKDVSKQVLEDFEDAWESTEDYRERAASNWALFAGELPKKSYPYENSANAHLPLMLENTTRIHTRAYSELFGDWTRTFNVLGIGPDDDSVAQILSRHGNWQLGQQLPDFKRQQARGLLIFFTMGDVTNHSYYDNAREQNAHEILTCDEFVTPYSHVTTMPDYSDLPYVCKIVHRYRHELEAMRDVWVDVDKVLERAAPSWEDDPVGAFGRSTAEAQRIEITDSKRSNAYKLIWYEGWVSDLPGQDRSRFCQVIVDYTTKIVLSLTIHEEEDWQDRERFDRQVAEGEQYSMALEQFTQMAQAFEQASQQHAIDQAAHAEVGAEVGSVAMDPQHHADMMAAHAQVAPQAPQPLPPRPPQPDWMIENGPEPLPVKRKPLHMFCHGVCIESLVGNLGLSYGHQQADHNRAVDTWISQFTDAATLANGGSFITTGTVDWDKPFQISPGKINRMKNVLAGDIDKHFKQLTLGQANPQLMELVSIVWDKAQSSIQSSPVLSGEAGKSGETFRGLNSRVEQASKQLSVPTSWYGEFFKKIVQNNAKLNAVYLRDEEIFMVNNDRAGTMEELKLGRKLYLRNYQITLASELTFSSVDAKIAAADEVLQMTNAFPQLQGNARFAYDALKKSLLLRSRQDLVDDLGPPPPPTTIPFGTPPPMPPGMVPGQPGAEGQPPGGAPTQ